MEQKLSSFPDILNHSKILRGFLDKTSTLTQLNQAVLKKCDPTLRTQCRVTNVRDGILILTATSPAWGHALRFAETELLTALKQDPNWCGIKSIQSRVRPHQTTLRDSNSHLPIPTLSPASALVIQSAAEDISTPRLKRALARLASRAVEA
jgi:hypothetical protein